MSTAKETPACPAGCRHRALAHRGQGRGKPPTATSKAGQLAPPCWFFIAGSSAVIASVIIDAIAALALGAMIGLMSGRNVLGTAVRQLAVAAVAATVTYGAGSLLGVSTS